MLILPRLGCSSPATERNSVVLPLPEAPKSATTSPGLRVIETPFRIGWSPYCKCRSSTTSWSVGLVGNAGSSLFMQAHSEAQREAQTKGDQRNVDQRQRGHLIDGPGAPQRNQHRADDFRPLPKQIDPGRVLALEDHEHQ